jgi:cytochrome b561
MAMKDTATGYGWVSIVLHWTTAVVVVVMLYLGASIVGLEGEERRSALVLHTSVAMTAYLILWLRIVWRFVFHHPGPRSAQGKVFFAIGKAVHMITLVALSFMLVSGPLMVWTSGESIQVFDWFAIPSPFEVTVSVSMFMRAVHHWSAIVIFIGILLHLGGVYKHTAFNQDGTLTKIIVPNNDAPETNA